MSVWFATSHSVLRTGSPQEGFGLPVLTGDLCSRIDRGRVQRVVARKIPRTLETHASATACDTKVSRNQMWGDRCECAGMRRVLAQRGRRRGGKKPLHRLVELVVMDRRPAWRGRAASAL